MTRSMSPCDEETAPRLVRGASFCGGQMRIRWQRRTAWQLRWRATQRRVKRARNVGFLVRAKVEDDGRLVPLLRYINRPRAH